MAVKPKTKKPKEPYHKDAIFWENVGKDYCAGASINSLAIKYKVSRPAIDRNIEKNQWKQDVSAIIAKEVAAKVAGVVSGLTQEQKTDAIDKESTRLTDIVKDHQREIREGRQIGSAIQELIKAKVKLLQDEYKASKTINTKELGEVGKIFSVNQQSLILAQQREQDANGIVLTPQESKATMNEDMFADIIKMAGAHKSKG
jgi:hypothetical protein